MRAAALALLLLAAACRKPAGPTLVLQTSKGEIAIRLTNSKGAPKTTEKFLKLVEAKAYDGLIFHRVISELIVQTGDPTGKGDGGKGEGVPDELDGSVFDRPGLVGMARWGPGSVKSQFFITLAPMPDIKGLNPLIGEVVSGLEVARAIAKVPRDERDGKDRPLDPPKLLSVRVR